MVYDPETNEPTLCKCEEDVPEGFLDAPVPEDEVVVPEVFRKRDVDAAYKKGFSDGVTSTVKKPSKGGKRKTAAEKTAANKGDKADKHTLKSLSLTADEAMDLLDEEKIEFGENATDDQLAALVGELLKDDKSE